MLSGEAFVPVNAGTAFWEIKMPKKRAAVKLNKRAKLTM
jgi:hypothetical protein